MNETREFYKNLLDNLHDGIYFLDRSKRITFWNKGAERLTGYEGSDVVENGYSEEFLAPINEKGTKAKDTFATIVQTANKLGVNIYHYLHDRISKKFAMPSLADLISEKNQIDEKSQEIFDTS